MKNIFKISFLFFLALSLASADECIEGDCENGTGTYLYSTGDKSGSKFTGEWKNGKRDGKGIIVQKDGTIFEGEYKNDKANGKGIWSFSDGHKLEGEFKDGRFIIETKIFPNGNKYTGEFKDNQFNGKGTYFFANGDKIVGDYKDDQIIKGTYSFVDGSKYIGEFKNALKNGTGTYIFTDGGRYEGQWIEDRRHGKGVYYVGIDSNEGNKGILKYEGNWNNDKRHGKFTKVFRNGDIQKIEYQNGQLVSKEQDINKLKAECNIQKFQDILNCDIETVIQKCDSLIGGGPSSQEYTFTKEPNNTFIRIDLKNCKSIFGNIFGMRPNVYAAWLWDKKKENNKAYKHGELFNTKEKVNIVLIHLYDLNKDKFNELYDYLKKNKKSSGSINKTSEVIDGKKNFVLWAFDKSEILLILKPSYLGDGWVGYLAYVRPELVSKIINSFLETDTSNNQL